MSQLLGYQILIANVCFCRHKGEVSRRIRHMAPALFTALILTFRKIHHIANNDRKPQFRHAQWALREFRVNKLTCIDASLSQASALRCDTFWIHCMDKDRPMCALLCPSHRRRGRHCSVWSKQQQAWLLRRRRGPPACACGGWPPWRPCRCDATRAVASAANLPGPRGQGQTGHAPTDPAVPSRPEHPP